MSAGVWDQSLKIMVSAVRFYRAVSMDYQTGEGISQYRYDITTHGPVVGAVFRF